MQKAGMDKEALRALLPEVGDVLVHTPHLHKSLGIESPTPRLCKVVYVNRENLWYRVQFDNGTFECYKLPRIEERYKGGWDKR